MSKQPSRGFLIFSLIWLGQLVSLIGSGLTSFALGVWVYQTKGSVMAYALILLATTAPNVLLSPLAGALVDRWDRRQAMLLSDIGAGISTLVIYLLFNAGQVRLWHILLAAASSSAFSAFQWPAYAASTTLLVPKKHLGRANGMIQLSQAIGYIASPALAGMLMATTGIRGVILIDFITFLFAVLTLGGVRIPRPEPEDEREVSPRALLEEITFGWRYLAERPGLMGILTLFGIANFLLGLVMALYTPMVLSFANTQVMGIVTSVGASGMLFGGALMSVWGGPERRINAVLGCMFIEGLALSIGGLSPSVPLVAGAAFVFFFCFPIDSASNNAIWQSKVDPNVQGRVFAMRNVVAMASMPVAYLLAGPLADRVFEPLLAPDGILAGSVGRLIGVGEGRGIGLMFILMGALTMVSALGGFLHPRIRLVEEDLPDFPGEEGTSSSAVAEPAPV